MKIAISSESSVDLDKVLLEKYDIHVLPYQILLGIELRLMVKFLRKKFLIIQIFSKFCQKQAL